MYAPTEYLRWAIRHYGRVAFDLATSGMTAYPLAELGVPARLDDASAWDALRARIGAFAGVTAEESLPAMGTTHGLWLAYASMLAPGDEVLVERPTYEPVYRIAEGCGARVTWFDRPPAERFVLDPARVARAMTDRTRVVAVTSLHNPSGVRASDEALREIATLAAARGAHLLVDEVYAPFDDLNDARGVWGASARRLGPNVVAVASLTKGWGLGAHRIGWMLAPPEVVARGEDAWIASLGHAPVPWLAFACRAFDQLGPIAARARALLTGKRARVEAWVARRPELAWSAPEHGLFGFAMAAQSTEDYRPRIERGIDAHQVIVAPGSFFGVPNGFRLAWSIDDAKLDEALARLDRVLA
jgi:aspartate/methionine/tyrosine aminotransferase